MRPELSDIDFISVMINAHWQQYDIVPGPGLKWDNDMKGLCDVCPLACYPHPLAKDTEHENTGHKLCTLTLLAAGFLKLDLMYYQEADRSAAIPLIEGLRKPVPEPSPEQPLQVVNPRPPKTRYIFGWMSAETSDRHSAQLYVEKVRGDWGVTYDPAQASRFNTVEAILEFYRKHGHVQGDVEVNIYNGHLMIFMDGPAGLCLIPKLTRQGSLFDNLPALEIIEQQPDLIKAADSAACFSRDENKVLTAGFNLVRYDRENKTVQCSQEPASLGWAPKATFITYAAAERTLKQIKDQGHIETGLDGKIIMSGWNQPGGLLKAGFEFYRIYGLAEYQLQNCCIKQGSKNWSNWGKYKDQVELEAAWDKLMKDPKALQG